jgi:negative regulator of replication initiation
MVILSSMKTTVEIPDELYQFARLRAASENRKIKDLVSEGLRIVLGLSPARHPFQPRRMTQAPVTIRDGNEIPVLTNDAMAELLEQSGERLP